jgi:uncharacterized lipoprotein YmbA
VTIEDLERGMKVLWDEHVHAAERLNRIEALQEKAELEIAEHRAWQADFRSSLADLRASESAMLDGLKRLAHVVTNIGEAQATLTEAQARTDEMMTALGEDLRKLAKRMDAFIAALRNGRGRQQ